VRNVHGLSAPNHESCVRAVERAALSWNLLDNAGLDRDEPQPERLAVSVSKGDRQVCKRDKRLELTSQAPQQLWNARVRSEDTRHVDESPLARASVIVHVLGLDGRIDEIHVSS
jgi:hypothetical protein